MIWLRSHAAHSRSMDFQSVLSLVPRLCLKSPNLRGMYFVLHTDCDPVLRNECE